MTEEFWVVIPWENQPAHLDPPTLPRALGMNTHPFLSKTFAGFIDYKQASAYCELLNKEYGDHQFAVRGLYAGLYCRK